MKQRIKKLEQRLKCQISTKENHESYSIDEVLTMATPEQRAIIESILESNQEATPKQKQTLEIVIDLILGARDYLIQKYGRIPELPAYP